MESATLLPSSGIQHPASSIQNLSSGIHHPASIMLTSLHITPAFANNYLPLSLQKKEKKQVNEMLSLHLSVFYRNSVAF